VTGAAVASLAGFDKSMEAFMRANGVRAAQLAIAKNGVMKFSRAYTWAEAGYRVTERSDRFLLASAGGRGSGPLRLRQAKVRHDSLSLAGLLPPSRPTQRHITIQQLLDHTGGYDDSGAGSGFDPTYNMRTIALALGLSKPVTKLDVARYMYGRPVDFTPGTANHYSNFGYLLAGAVVEHVSGMAYAAYVNKTLLQPAGINEVQVISTLASLRSSNEAIEEDQGLGLSPLNLTSQLLVTSVYGGMARSMKLATRTTAWVRPPRR
jgi:CubicO group peptidase (beta-lactamase class C family)